MEKLPFPGKHKLEGVVQGQSLSNCRRPRKDQPVENKFLKELEKFQNPDPLYRLIGDANESTSEIFRVIQNPDPLYRLIGDANESTSEIFRVNGHLHPQSLNVLLPHPCTGLFHRRTDDNWELESNQKVS